MTTGGARVVSPSSKSRPSMSGSRSVRSSPGETTLVSRATVSVTSAVPRLDSKLAPVSPAERQRAGPAHDLDAVERRQLLEQRPAVGDPTHGIAESPRELDRHEGDACEGRRPFLPRARAIRLLTRWPVARSRTVDSAIWRADEQRAQTGTAVLVRDAAGVCAQRGDRGRGGAMKSRRDAEERPGQAGDSNREQDDVVRRAAVSSRSACSIMKKAGITPGRPDREEQAQAHRPRATGRAFRSAAHARAPCASHRAPS